MTADSASTLKRELDGGNEPDCKKSKLEEVPAPAVDYAKVKRQVEYYFSDENLKYDRFFHERIAADSEGWLPIANVLSCRRIQNLRATAPEIIKALEGSHLETKSTGENEWAIRRTTPLPPLEERPQRSDNQKDARNKQKAGKKGGDAKDCHMAGCIVKVSGIPEEASWEELKKLLDTKLPDQPTPPPGPDGKERKPYSSVQFISTPSATGTALALLAPFEADQKFVSDGQLGDIELNGAKLKVELVWDSIEVGDFVKSMPGLIRRKRDREIQRLKREMKSRPIKLGGAEFSSIEHLRNCLKEVVREYPPGKLVNQKTSLVIDDLLKYHPNGEAKLKDKVDFKVDEVDLNGTKTKCFMVVRSDGSVEDFSLQKCISAMAQNPPFVTGTTDVTGTADVTNQENNSPSKEPTA